MKECLRSGDVIDEPVGSSADSSAERKKNDVTEDDMAPHRGAFALVQTRLLLD